MRKVKKPVFFIVLLCIIAFGYLTYAGIHTQYGDIKTSYIKGVEDIRWGIDIQGGVNATFEPADNYDATKEEMDAAKAVIEQRLVSLNITDSEVYVDYKKNKVMVSFPWQANEESFDPEAAVSELGETAKLVFRKGKEEIEENQLSPGSIGISPLSTPHPHPFQRMWVRTSIAFYGNFILDMDRSPGFGSTPSDLTPY